MTCIKVFQNKNQQENSFFVAGNFIQITDKSIAITIKRIEILADSHFGKPIIFCIAYIEFADVNIGGKIPSWLTIDVMQS